MTWYMNAMVGFLFVCEVARLGIGLALQIRQWRMMRRFLKHQKEALAAIDGIGRSVRAN